MMMVMMRMRQEHKGTNAKHFLRFLYILTSHIMGLKTPRVTQVKSKLRLFFQSDFFAQVINFFLPEKN